MYGGEYAYFSVTSGETYTWTTCSDSDFDTQLSLYQGTTCGGTNLAYNDDDCGLQSTITWTATFTGTVTVLLSEYSCNSNSTCMTLEWSVSGGGGGTASDNCDDALPFCTSDSYTFPASTNVPDMGSVDCLYTTPNPAWYWMEINDPGDIDIYISSGADVDFIAWGPFNSLSEGCATDLMSTSGVDCSYSTSATETCNLTGTQAGEVYILLITNYANVETNISFSQTAGSGTTNCGIIAPPIENNGPLCEGETLQLTVTDPEAGATYSWTGPNGFSSSDMNPTVPNVTTADAGTYSLQITIGPDTSDPVTTDVVVNTNVTPTFNAVGPYCQGDAIPALPTASNEGITGSWSPAIDNTTTTTYTFTPDAGQCALSTTMTVDITAPTTPTFTQVGPYCQGDAIPALPTTSNEGIQGSWSPAINNISTTTYTFTPDAGECATTTTMTIDITNPTTPTFTQVGPYCEGSSVPALPATSNEGIQGSWSPAIDNTTTTTYTFTPDAGECATTTTMTIDITAQTVPTFDPVGPYCQGSSIPALPTTSNEGITGTWSPAIDNMSTTTYTFSPAAGQCATSTVLTIDITMPETPVFDPVGPFCAGATIADLPTTSNNGIAGSWSPAIDNTATTTYTFTPAAGECALNTDLTITVHENPQPAADNTGPVCEGQSLALSSEPTGMQSYTWSGPDGFSSVEQNPIVSNLAELSAAGTYTVLVEDNNGCTAQTTTDVNVHPNPDISINSEDPLCYESCDGEIEMSVSTGTPPYEYSLDSSATGQSFGLFVGLCEGAYYPFVTDAYGCTAGYNTVYLENPPELTGSVVSVTNQNCQAPGSAEVTASGGTPAYTYFWPADASEVNGSSASSIPAGDYNVTVEDAQGCSELIPLTIGADDDFSVNASVRSNVSCYGEYSGEIQVEIVSGTPEYTVAWSGGTQSGAQLSYSISNLSVGVYSITVSDTDGCSESFDMYINGPDMPLRVDVQAQDVSCFGDKNGLAQAMASGGTSPYTYTWFKNSNHVSNSAAASHLSGGLYQLELLDDNGCRLDTSVFINEPPEILVDFMKIDPSCIGNNNGAIELEVSGGEEPYNYLWGSYTSNLPYLDNLNEGDYDVAVRDATGCEYEVGTISLTDNPVECLRVPTAFTPNGDDNNDTWRIENLEMFPKAVVHVYNRWGQIVYNAGTGEEPWDGTDESGKLVSTGSYLYVINLYNGANPYSGIVTVVY
jgi:gliding motility-associated-like protein